jgi:predicted RNA binding protein YcfA (HicA-like mRNA interferase family)
MSKTEKLLAAVRNNPRGVRFDELVRLVKALGFVLDRQGGSSHAVYVHGTRPEIPFLNLQPAKGGTAKAYQVEQVLDRVDAFNLEVL